MGRYARSRLGRDENKLTETARRQQERGRQIMCDGQEFGLVLGEGKDISPASAICVSVLRLRKVFGRLLEAFFVLRLRVCQQQCDSEYLEWPRI